MKQTPSDELVSDTPVVGAVRKTTQEVINADCLTYMKTLPDKSFDLVISDPPYGMNFQSHHRNKMHAKIEGDDSFPIEVIDEFKRIARKAVYVFCRWDNLKDFPPPEERSMLGQEQLVYG